MWRKKTWNGLFFRISGWSLNNNEKLMFEIFTALTMCSMVKIRKEGIVWLTTLTHTMSKVGIAIRLSITILYKIFCKYELPSAIRCQRLRFHIDMSYSKLNLKTGKLLRRDGQIWLLYRYLFGFSVMNILL